VAPDHTAIPSKDRTGLFNGLNAKLTEQHGKQIREWLERGAVVQDAAPTEPAPAPKSVWSAGNGHPGPESSGDQAAARTPREPTQEAFPAPLLCSTEGCGKALTRGQHDISVRSFGSPFCPACQKTHQRAA
jgi:hypothetical protein